jgi:excinuclease ABC subunit A
MVDQSPIGKSARSNPVSYVGAFDPIRKLFAASAEAKRARLHAGTFSFNSGNGPLPDLRRQRLRARRDAVPVRRLSALPGLRRQALPRRGARGALARASRSPTCWRLTVSEALLRDFLRRRARRAGARRLQPLADVGLEYLRSASRCRRCPAARRSA